MTVPDAACLLYDGDCAFCTSAAARGGRLLGMPDRFVPWQAHGAAALGIEESRLESEVVWWDGRRDTVGGADAIATLLRLRGGGYGVLGRLMVAPGVRVLVRAAYRLVARNRHRLPGSTDACRLDRT